MLQTNHRPSHSGSLTLDHLLQAPSHDVDVLDVVELVDHVGVVASALVALARRLVGHSVDLRGGSQGHVLGWWVGRNGLGTGEEWTGDWGGMDWTGLGSAEGTETKGRCVSSIVSGK